MASEHKAVVVTEHCQGRLEEPEPEPETADVYNLRKNRNEAPPIPGAQRSSRLRIMDNGRTHTPGV
jgi:hypothetical protein